MESVVSCWAEDMVVRGACRRERYLEVVGGGAMVGALNGGIFEESCVCSNETIPKGAYEMSRMCFELWKRCSATLNPTRRAVRTGIVRT